MATLYDENGNAIEAFTKEELEAKQKEAVETYLKENPDKSTDITRLESELSDAKKKLDEAEKGGMNDGQKERLKAAKEAAEAALKDSVSSLQKEIADLRDTITSGTKNKVISALSKGDKDIQEKIDLKFQSLMKTGDYKNDEAGITQALTEAATLVTGARPAPGFLDGMTGAGDRGNPQGNKGATVETENSKAIRVALGITDADVAKHAPKLA